MIDSLRTAESNVLNGPDDHINGPAKEFLKRVIERRLGIWPPLPQIEPPVHLSPQEMGRKMIEAAQKAQPAPVQPAPERELGQPRARGATVDQATGQVELPRDLREIKPMPKADLPAPNQRNGKWCGRPFDLENEMQPQGREPGE